MSYLPDMRGMAFFLFVGIGATAIATIAAAIGLGYILYLGVLAVLA